LQRADVIVVREDEFEAIGKRVWTLLREGAQMWTVRRILHFPAPLFVFGAGLRPVAFCAIARPENFAAMLQNAGCGVIETVAFDDHRRYGMADIERVIEVAKSLNGSGFVTTEKDAVKLTAAMRERLEQHGPLMIVALEAEFADAQAVMRALEAKLLAAEAQAL
jgi:tetraacyldisaccharide 4'-kinase